VMMGALEGGMAMWKGLGPAHALALALDELDSSLHHGTTVGVLMPYCLAGFATAAPEKHAHLRGAMGLPFGADIAAAFRHLNASIGLPASIGALGVAAGCVDRAARSAAASFFNASSPKRGTVDDYAMLLAQALGTERRRGAAAPAQQAPSGLA
jgi:4-hydroxybutyrate dehydrogenase